MQTDKYINDHLNEALEYVNQMIGKKELYTHDDAYKLLKSFSFIQEIEFDEIKDFIPSAMKAPSSIEEYTSDFISSNYDNRIYALNYGTGFIIIIISAANGYITSYYGDTINDFTLKIYYSLEVMCKHLFN